MCSVKDALFFYHVESIFFNCGGFFPRIIVYILEAKSRLYCTSCPIHMVPNTVVATDSKAPMAFKWVGIPPVVGLQ